MDVRIPAPLSFVGNVAENFKRFKQNFEVYLIASGKDVKESKVKVAILLNIMGEEGVEVYNTLKLDDEEKQDYEKVIKKLEEFVIPRKNVVYERFMFYNRKQEEGEPFDHFLTDLKKLEKSCEFGSETESMIRDRIVLGIRNKDVQEKLLRISELNLDKAIEVCRANEISSAQIKDVQQKEKIEVIKKYSNKNKEENSRKTSDRSAEYNCGRCGNKHGPRKCPAYGRKCTKCKKYNHYQNMCRSRLVREIGQHRDSECVEEDEEEVMVTCISINEISSTEWLETIEIETKAVQVKIDSGAQVNVMSKNTLLQILGKNNVKLHKTKLVLESYGGFKIRPLGTTDLNCKFKNRNYVLKFVIVECKSKTILGLRSSIDMQLIKQIDSLSSIQTQDEFIKHNLDVFTGVGKYSKKCHLKVKEGCTPIAKPPRRIPLSLKNKLKHTLSELESKGIIAGVSEPTEWLNNLVIIEKQDNTLRICLDPKDLNKVLERQFCLKELEVD